MTAADVVKGRKHVVFLGEGMDEYMFTTTLSCTYTYICMVRLFLDKMKQNTRAEKVLNIYRDLV